jgi:hypothetical protein
MQRNHVVSALLAVGLAAVGGGLLAADADWLTDDGTVVELKLAHMDKDRLDGGILRIDRAKRLVLWEGVPGDIGCKAKVEAKFEDVKSVDTDDRQAGFELEVKKGNPRKLRLIPLPHAALLLQQAQVTGGSLQNSMDNAGVTGPDGLPMKVGGSSGGGPSTKRLQLPKEAVADTQKAVDAIKQALRR